MSSNDEQVERKANPDAEIPADGESATGDMLTGFSLGVDAGTLAGLSLAAFLFGGVVLVVAGVALWALSVLGLYPTLAVLGGGCIMFALLLAQVYARKGLI
jgi:hypothetical protein